MGSRQNSIKFCALANDVHKQVVGHQSYNKMVLRSFEKLCELVVYFILIYPFSSLDNKTPGEWSIDVLFQKL